MSSPEEEPPNEPEWGFVVYRTTYSNGSNSHWDDFKEKLEKYIRDGVEGMFGDPNTEEWKRPDLQIREDRILFNNTTLGALREHFTENQDENDPFQWHNVFLLFDEEVFQAVQDAESDVEEQLDKDLDFPWVKAVNALYDEDDHESDEPDEPELIKVAVNCLHAFYLQLRDGEFSE
jgi:hypothetical protein